jgi:pimeloyl-ACP methyl ester carboxylesterase
MHNCISRKKELGLNMQTQPMRIPFQNQFVITNVFNFFILVLFLTASNYLSAQERIMVDVGGHKLDVKIKRGGPVNIIFEAGSGDDLSSWDSIFDQVGKFATIISYSRSGLGDSELSKQPRNTEMIYKDFTVLCDSLSINQPVILVGHSWGAFLVRYYTMKKPEFIKGLVLIDGSHEEQEKRLFELDSTTWKHNNKRMLEIMDMAKSGKFEVPKGAILEAEANYLNKMVIRGGEDMSPLPDIPIAVFTSLSKPEYSKDRIQLWRDMHSEWTMSSKNIIWMVTDKYGHYLHQEQPKLVLNIIKYITNITIDD